MSKGYLASDVLLLIKGPPYQQILIARPLARARKLYLTLMGTGKNRIEFEIGSEIRN